MGGLEALLPTGGIAAALVAVILYLLRANTVDRKDYREAVALLERRIEVQVAANETLQDLLDEQRALRRKAEDEAARATIATERTGFEVASLRDEVKLLRAQVAEMKKL